MRERSLVLLKPDCLERDLVRPIMQCLEDEVDVVAVRRIIVDERQVLEHYCNLVRKRGEWGRARLCEMYVGKEVMAILVEGDAAIARVRRLIGDGDPAFAPPGTIRRRFCIDSYERARREDRLVHNLIHGSESVDDAAREIGIWFPKEQDQTQDIPFGGP